MFDGCPGNDQSARFEGNEVPSNVTKSLPDFLNDGLILNKHTEPTNSSKRAESPVIQVTINANSCYFCKFKFNDLNLYCNFKNMNHMFITRQ